jgi:hypothetical protein
MVLVVVLVVGKGIALCHSHSVMEATWQGNIYLAYGRVPKTLLNFLSDTRATINLNLLLYSTYLSQNLSMTAVVTVKGTRVNLLLFS